MKETRIEVLATEGRSVTAITSEPERSRLPWLFVYAPGAGSNVHDPFGTYWSVIRLPSNTGTAGRRISPSAAQSTWSTFGSVRIDPSPGWYD